MGKVIKNSSGQVVLSGDKALEVTAAIDSNIVAENIKKDVEILGVTGTYEGSGGGGSLPYITNPLNGGNFGANANGTYTHQYQVSSGTIVQCSLLALTGTYDMIDPEKRSYPNTKYSPVLHNAYVYITNDGLLTLYLSGNNTEYPWTVAYNTFVVLLTLNTGHILVDTFYPYFDYSCFIKGTKIYLADGQKKNIQDVNYEDKLLVWNFDEGKYDESTPLWIKKSERAVWYYLLRFSDGTELKVTGAYPNAHSLFSVEYGAFVHSNELVGKKVYSANGIVTLSSCEMIKEDVEYYNIITSYHMNLFANGILASTSLNNLYPINDMKFIKDARPRIPKESYGQDIDDKYYLGMRLNEQKLSKEYIISYIDNLRRTAKQYE